MVSNLGGTERESLEDALLVAVASAREVMCAEVQNGRLCPSCCIVIEDAGGVEVGRVPFRDTLTISGL